MGKALLRLHPFGVVLLYLSLFTRPLHFPAFKSAFSFTFALSQTIAFEINMRVRVRVRVRLRVRLRLRLLRYNNTFYLAMTRRVTFDGATGLVAFNTADNDRIPAAGIAGAAEVYRWTNQQHNNWRTVGYIADGSVTMDEITHVTWAGGYLLPPKQVRIGMFVSQFDVEGPVNVAQLACASVSSGLPSGAALQVG